MILDACRNSPFRGFSRDAVSGLAEIRAPHGTLIAYATAPGQTASDGDGENSPYVEALLRAMRQPGWDVERVFKAVRAEVRRKTQGKQVPWESTSLEGEFYFCRTNSAPVQTEPGGVGVEVGASVPVGGRAGEVWASPAGIRLVWIPPGEFEMGEDPEEDLEADIDEDIPYEDDECAESGDEYCEGPVHRVRITRGLWLGETEVTQAQWAAVMGNNPSHFEGCPECPVEQVSWEDCRVFVRKLNERYRLGGGLVWRLPYEAEWEYACRAGTQGYYYGGNGESRLERVGWYDKNSGEQTRPVRRLRANGWGLYDMHGNVWEWCEDWYKWDYYRISPVEDPRGPGSGKCRVLRGGAWDDDANSCRAASRAVSTPAYRNYSLGLRVAVGAP
ncbi:MAG: SUMF1/EgtB/PvdO family nonheme iron enzyme [Chloracidobacterium sp.]|nr:SUMF1/EgtB/PvdO family nonheme iron enzyme [Chloracidobacterium sp.]